MLFLRAQSGHMLYDTIVEVLRPSDDKEPDRGSVRKSIMKVTPFSLLPSSKLSLTSRQTDHRSLQLERVNGEH